MPGGAETVAVEVGCRVPYVRIAVPVEATLHGVHIEEPPQSRDILAGAHLDGHRPSAPEGKNKTNDDQALHGGDNYDRHSPTFCPPPARHSAPADPNRGPERHQAARDLNGNGRSNESCCDERPCYCPGTNGDEPWVERAPRFSLASVVVHGGVEDEVVHEG